MQYIEKYYIKDLMTADFQEVDENEFNNTVVNFRNLYVMRYEPDNINRRNFYRQGELEAYIERVPLIQDKSCDTCKKRESCTRATGALYGYCNVDYQPDVEKKYQQLKAAGTCPYASLREFMESLIKEGVNE